MHCRLILWSIGMVLVSLSGCVSKSQLSAVSSEHQLARQQIADGEKQMEALRLSIQKLKKETSQCRKGQNQLRQKIEKMNTENKLLSQKVEKMNAENKLLSQKVDTFGQTIKKKETIISLQETFIRLFDNSKQTIQNSIKKQIKEQNL
ncbi:MAG: hypothetical protein JRH15_07655 [Deltaproteobacteria bacterium]|nr:hypothetical protein [Deltaproteobacteria bacterium]